MEVLLRALDIYTLIILIRVFMSWIRPNPYHPLVRLIYNVTEPVLEPIRRIIPPIGMGIDISPIVAFFLIRIIRRVILSLLI